MTIKVEILGDASRLAPKASSDQANGEGPARLAGP
jgi:hypothetical protein